MKSYTLCSLFEQETGLPGRLPTSFGWKDNIYYTYINKIGIHVHAGSSVNVEQKKKERKKEGKQLDLIPWERGAHKASGT